MGYGIKWLFGTLSFPSNTNYVKNDCSTVEKHRIIHKAHW